MVFGTFRSREQAEAGLKEGRNHMVEEALKVVKDDKTSLNFVEKALKEVKKGQKLKAKQVKSVKKQVKALKKQDIVSLDEQFRSFSGSITALKLAIVGVIEATKRLKDQIEANKK